MKRVNKRIRRCDVRKRGRPTRRFLDVVIEDMSEVEVMEEDTEDRIQ